METSMALKKCKECGRPVSTKATSCPKCGAVLKKQVGCFSVIVSVFLIIMLISIMSSSKPNRSSRPISKRLHTQKTPNSSNRISEKETSQVASTLKWYEGGTLHKKNAITWQKASQRNKLATCADFVAALWQNKIFKPSLQNSIRSMNDLKPLAKELVVQLDEAFKKFPNADKNQNIYANQKVDDTVKLLLILMDWCK